MPCAFSAKDDRKSCKDSRGAKSFFAPRLSLILTNSILYCLPRKAKLLFFLLQRKVPRFAAHSLKFSVRQIIEWD